MVLLTAGSGEDTLVWRECSPHDNLTRRSADVNRPVTRPLPDVHSIATRYSQELERIARLFEPPRIPVHATMHPLLVSRSHFSRPSSSARAPPAVTLAGGFDGRTQAASTAQRHPSPGSAASLRLPRADARGAGAGRAMGALADAMAVLDAHRHDGNSTGAVLPRFPKATTRPDFRERAVVQRHAARAWVLQREHGRGSPRVLRDKS